jgi:hypothetical protein
LPGVGGVPPCWVVSMLGGLDAGDGTAIAVDRSGSSAAEVPRA